MKARSYLVVAEVIIADSKAMEIESWAEDITTESYIQSVIRDHVQDRGMLCKTAIVEGDLYNDVKEYAHVVANNKAVAELEAEILEAKNCVGGNCDD